MQMKDARKVQVIVSQFIHKTNIMFPPTESLLLELAVKYVAKDTLYPTYNNELISYITYK